MKRSPRQTLRHYRRQGALAMLDHLLRGAPPPANPFPPSDRRRHFFQWGVQTIERLQLEDPA